MTAARFRCIMGDMDRFVPGTPKTLAALWQLSKDTYGGDGRPVFAANALRMLADRHPAIGLRLRRLQAHVDSRIDRRYGVSGAQGSDVLLQVLRRVRELDQAPAEA